MMMVLVIVGVILMVVGGVVFFAMGAQPINVETHGVYVNPGAVMELVRYGVSGLLWLLGGIFFLSGLIGLGRSSSRKNRQLQIMEKGIDAEGTVTYVDKNYKILVNHAPIYSIVEYTYVDANGATHARRVDHVNSELVIRRQVQVGSRISVKYAPENPSESVMILG